MAHFYCSTENSRGNAVTASGRKSGQRTHARGWSAGVEIVASADGTPDTFDLYMTTGSNGHGRKISIGRVVDSESGPTFLPAHDGRTVGLLP